MVQEHKLTAVRVAEVSANALRQGLKSDSSLSGAFKSMDRIYKRLGIPESVFSMDFDQKERHRLFVEFLNGCNQEGIPDMRGFTYLNLVSGKYEEKNGKDMSGGQCPEVVGLSSSSNTNVFELLFSRKYEVERNLMKGGAFLDSRPISEENSLKETSDMTPTVYMLNHLKEHQEHESGNPGGFKISRDVAPYIPCIGNYMGDGTRAFENAARIQISRLGKLAVKFREHGHSTPHMGQGLNVLNLNFHENRFAMLPIVNDVMARRLYVVWETKGGAVKKMPFEDFVEKAGFGGHKVVRKNLASLRDYEKDGNITELIKRRPCCKEVCCVDARCGGSVQSDLVKMIGSFFTKEELRRFFIAEGTGKITVQLHTECGYMKTAIALDGLLQELSEARKNPARTAFAGEMMHDLYRIASGEVRSMRLTEDYAKNMVAKVGLTGKDAVEMFNSILIGIPIVRENAEAGSEGREIEAGASASDYQRIVKHLFDRGIIEAEFNPLLEVSSIRVGAVKKVKEMLAENGISHATDSREFLYLFTEEVGRRLRESASEVIEEFGPSSGKIFNIYIKNLKNGGRFDIPQEATAANMADFGRIHFSGADSVSAESGRTGDVLRERIAVQDD